MLHRWFLIEVLLLKHDFKFSIPSMSKKNWYQSIEIVFVGINSIFPEKSKFSRIFCFHWKEKRWEVGQMGITTGSCIPFANFVFRYTNKHRSTHRIFWNYQRLALHMQEMLQQVQVRWKFRNWFVFWINEKQQALASKHWYQKNLMQSNIKR